MAADRRLDRPARRLKRVEAPGVTSLDPPPPFWTHAEGVRVTDASGRVLLDLTGAFGVALAGHRHPRIVERVKAQVDRLLHGMGDVHPPLVKIEFLEALAARMPWPDARAILGLSGSDAVEAALKTAQLATGRIGVVAFEGGYHGLTLGALAATHRRHFRSPFVERLVPHVRFAPFPTSPSGEERALNAVRRLLSSGASVPVGAVVVEPIQGRAGVRVPPATFLPRLAEVCRADGALLVVDEIFTGMGRAGAFLACELDGVVPDLVCMGKALGGGMPLSACSGPAAVMEAWPPSRGEAVHTSTFQGHPASCAAGLAALETLAAEDLAGRARRLGDRALAYLKAELGASAGVVDVRGRGLMIGVELRSCDDGPPAVAVARRALTEGLVVLPSGARGEVVSVTPPAIVRWRELEEGLRILVGAVKSLDRASA